MKFNKDLLKEKWFAYTVAGCLCVMLYMILTHLVFFWRVIVSIWQVGRPVFLALVIAYVMDPLVDLFSKNVFSKVTPNKLRHTLSVVTSIISVVVFFAVLMVALIPQVVGSVIQFAGNFNAYVLTAHRLIRQLNSITVQQGINLSKLISSSDELLLAIRKWLPENVNKILNFSFGFGSSLFGWLISFILAIYLMLDGPRMKRSFDRLLRALLPSSVYQNTSAYWSRCNSILIQYIAFDLLDGLIIGLVNWIFMLIMKMPYVAIVSFVVGITNLAPTFGPMAGAVIGAFILVLVNPWHALWFLLFTLVLQTVDGYILKPRLFGGQLGVSSVWILISLIIGGRLLGVVGILLAIPFAAIADYTYHEYILRRLEANREHHARLEAEASGGLKEEDSHGSPRTHPAGAQAAGGSGAASQQGPSQAKAVDSPSGAASCGSSGIQAAGGSGAASQQGPSQAKAVGSPSGAASCGSSGIQAVDGSGAASQQGLSQAKAVDSPSGADAPA